MQHAVIVAGFGFGDEGKGTVVDALVRHLHAPLVVRYNGGPQAAHHVVDAHQFPDAHAFHQFGSGTFAGARTHLSRFMLVDPLQLDIEAGVLGRRWRDSITIDPRCRIVTPYHQAMNRLRELSRGDERHGSCGMGIGELRQDEEDGFPALRMDSLGNEEALTAALNDIRQRKFAEAHLIAAPPDSDYFRYLSEDNAAIYARLYRSVARSLVLCEDADILNETDGPVVFEGAQGVLLDEVFGFAPHTTWSNTTFEHALSLAREVHAPTTCIGVIRSFFTRHGAGPLPTGQALWRRMLDDDHNTAGEWQGAMRAGPMDLPLLRYAMRCCGGADGLAITHLDKVTSDWPIANGGRALWEPDRLYYRVNGPDGLCLDISDELGLPVVLQSYGKTAADKIISIECEA